MKTYIDANGYERNEQKKYVHRSVAEKALGKSLPEGSIVHHIDGNKSNNSPSNLVICQGEAYHRLLHARQRVLDLGGHPDTHSYCSYHECLHETSQFSTRTGTWNGRHNMCRTATNEYRKDKGLNRDKFDWRARLNQQYRRAFKSDKVQISPWEESR